MKFRCPHCQKILTVKDEFAARKGKCPACQTMIIAPRLPAQPSVEPPQPPPAQVPPPASRQPSAEMSGPEISPSSEELPLPPPLPPEPEPPLQLPDSFFGRLLYSSEQERKEILGLIFGSAIIGLIAGAVWGGLFNPWEDNTIATALFNGFLFGGWGTAESLGILAARNFQLAKTREKLMLAAGICGGLWVGLWTAIDQVMDPGAMGLMAVKAVIGFITGALIGGGLSVVSTIKLSKIFIPEEKKPARKPPSRGWQQRPPAKKGMSTGAKVALGVGAGCLLIIVIGAAIIGGLTYKFMKEVGQNIEEERESLRVDMQVDAFEPEPLPAANLETNLLKNGSFQTLEGWAQHDTTDAEDQISLETRENYVVWTRTNSRSESRGLGLYQDDLELNVSGANTLMIDLDVWVGGQTLDGAGWLGNEAPMLLEIMYLDQESRTHTWRRGFIMHGEVELEHIMTVPQATWTHVSFDLMDAQNRLDQFDSAMPAPATILKVMVYGNGWDFKGAVGNLCIRKEL
jgi:hypothetical protein